MARIMVNGSTTVSLPQGADVQSSVNLNALNDVTLTNPQQDQLLTYSGGQWVNQSWADLGSGTTITPDAVRLKQYELPDWAQFSYNLDDSVPLSVNANSIAHSSWRRSTSSTGRTVAMNGLFYDFQNTSPSAWENIGPGFAWGIADQYSVYYAGNVDVRTEPGSITTDLTGNMDTFQTRMDWRVYEKFSGSPNVTGYNIMTLRKDSATFDGNVDITNDLDIGGTISSNKYTLPGFFANPNPAYNPQNIPGIVSLCGEGVAAINIWKREPALQPGSMGYLGMYYDTYTNPTPDDWKGRGPYLSMPIADKRSIFNLGAFRIRISPDVNPTLDIDGNLDSYTGEFLIESYDKLPGNDTAVRWEGLSASSYQTTLKTKDRTNGNTQALRIYSDADYNVIDGSEVPNGIRFVNNLTADGKLSMKAYSIPSSPQYGGANIGDVTDAAIIRDTPASLSMRRFTGTTTGFVNITGAFYDKTDTNPANWTSCGSYSPFVIADQQATFTHAAIKTNFVEVTTDGIGNLDSFVGKLVVETWDKRPGTNQSSGVDRFEPLRVSSDGTSFNVKDRNTGTPYDFSYYAEDGIFRLTSSAGAFRFQQSVEAAQDFEVLGTSMIVHASQVDFTNLPTTDPLVAGRLWNDAGTMKISAG